VIEDCAEAFGASYKGRPVGAFGDVAAFSFYFTTRRSRPAKAAWGFE